MIKHDIFQLYRVLPDRFLGNLTIYERREENKAVITRLRNSCLITFSKKYRSNHRICRGIHRRRSVKRVFLKISQTSQENTFVGVFF